MAHIDLVSIDRFHTSLGRALSRWQYVESAMFVAAHTIMGTSHPISSAVFFHIKSGESKLALLDKLWQTTLTDKTAIQTWTELRKRASSGLLIRNALAHFEISLLNPSALADELKGITAHPVALMPHHLSQPLDGAGKVKALFIEQLDETAAEYFQLSADILAFVWREAPNAEQRTKSLPPSLQQALDLIQRKAMP